MEAGDEGVAAAAAASIDDAATAVTATAFEHNDAYAQHFKTVLQTVVVERPDWRKLFSQQELALATAFLHELEPIEQQLYARLFQRKGPWFKTTALFRYFTQKPYAPTPMTTGANDGEDDAAVETAEDASIAVNDDDDDDAVSLTDSNAAPATAAATVDTADAAAQQLPDNRVVQTALQSLLRHGFFETLAVQSTTVASIATSSASVASTHSDAALAQALDALQHCAAAPEVASLQKLLTGSRATKKRTKQRVSPTSSSSNSTASSSSKADALDAIRSVVMTQRRIDGSRIPLARLLHHVFFGSYPLAGKSMAQDVFVVHLSATPRDLFDRMHRLVYFQASLPFSTSAAPFATQPTCDAFAAAAARLLEDATQWPGLMVRFRKVVYPTYAITIVHDVFPSSAAYVCYEVARQLHAILLLVEPALTLDSVGEDGANLTQAQDLEPKWLAFDEPPELLAFQKLMETDDDGFELLTFDNNDGAPVVVDWQIESWQQFRRLLRDRLTSLDAFCLEARRCFHAFGTWTAAQARVAMTPATPPFFAKCSAGYHLARVLHHAVALYEKQRQYQVAVLLLNDLLAAPFLQRKRGHWWERLALNLEHLACHGQARMACVNALDDVHVVGADRFALMRRLRRLEKRSGTGTSAAAQQSATDRDRDDFESLVSDNDDDVDRGSPGNATETTDAVATPLDEYAYRREHIVGRPLNRQTAEKSRFIGYDDEPCTVEQLVLQYYRSQRKAPDDPGTGSRCRQRGGWYGVHCEGRILGNLFGVCMWDVLYASVPDVFQTPFQAAPLDFGDAASFVSARRDLIDAKLAKLRHEWSMTEILDDIALTWHREFGKVSRFVSWPNAHALPLEFHQLVAMAMGPMRLANLMEYMLTSPEYHRAQNGLPDLLLLRGTRAALDGDDEQPQHSLPVDSDHGCLDIFAFCHMVCPMNLNDRTADDAFERDEEPNDNDGAESSEAPSLVEQLGGWSLELKLVEVKGPRDRLSDKQTLWLQVLNDDVGLDAAVTHVVEDAKTLEKKLMPKNPKPKNPNKQSSRPAAAKPTASNGKRSAKRQKK